MKRTSLLAVFIFCFICSVAGQAQKARKDSASTHDKGLFLQIPLVPMLQGSYRMEVDKKFFKGIFSVHAGAGIYNSVGHADTRRINYEYHDDLKDVEEDDLIRGYNLSLGTRIFLPAVREPNQEEFILPYIGIEGMYRDIDISYIEYTWTTYTSNGLVYYDFDLHNMKGKIIRRSVSLLMGIQLRERRWSYDISGGICFNNTRVDSQLAHDRDYSQFIWDLGRSGENVTFNVKLGYQIVR